MSAGSQRKQLGAKGNAFHKGGGAYGSGLMPQPGSTEHALAVLVLIELAALVLLRRYMKSAHGG